MRHILRTTAVGLTTLCSAPLAFAHHGLHMESSLMNSLLVMALIGVIAGCIIKTKGATTF